MNRVRDERLTFGECRDALIELMNLGFCWRCESADNELFRDPMGSVRDNRIHGICESCVNARQTRINLHPEHWPNG